MDENTNQQPTTPLGNERSLTPGQDNIASNNLPTLPNIDENTPLNDITKQYTDIGTAHAGLVENAADNVGDRQVQLVGNDFGATNPYMFNTYYEPASTSFASEMRKQGTQRAVEVGLERAEEEAKKNAENAQKRYNNAVAAAKQRQQEAAAARAHISETDSSKMPQGTNEREVLNSEAFKKMNDKEREDALTSARTLDLQAMLGNRGVKDWNIKEQRNYATSVVKKEFPELFANWKNKTQAEKDAVWARKDVGNRWTELYMIADFKRRGDGGKMVESFNDIHNDVRTIVKAVKDSTVSKLDQHVFETLAPIASAPDVKDWKFDNIKKSIENSNLDQARKDEYIAAMNAIGKDQFERLWKGYANKNLEIGDDGMLKHAGSTIGYNGLNGNNNPKYTYNGKSDSVGFAIKAIYNSFAGNVDNIENMSAADWVGSVNYIDNFSFTSPQDGLSVDQRADELFTNAFGVDWSSISALAKLQEEHPDDFNYLLNQSSYILASGGAPFDVVDDPNKKYYIDGKYWSVNDEDSPLKMGDLVFYSVDLPKNDKGEYADEDLNRFIELYSDIYTGKKEATDENKEALNKYYSSYQTSLAAAMAASARYGTKVDENIYSAVLSMRDGADLSKLRISNPSKPEETISLDELGAWFNSFNEDAQYNGYAALVNRTRGLKGRYYIYDDKMKGVTSVTERQNGVNTIGKYGKTSGSNNMEMANQVANLSDDQCLALNLFLDSQMKSGKIKTNFFDNDEVSFGDSLANQMLNGARGTATMIGAAGTFMWGFLTGQDKVISEAGKMWDEMTTLDQFDNMSWAGNSSRTDATLFNNYTEDVRKMQRSNLNHLIDTTFNIDYFDPNNTYDETTGEVKNSKGEVISYADNSYFHKDDWKGFTDTMAGMAGFVAEATMEALATGGIGTAVKAGKLALKGTSAGVKISQAKNVLANYLTSAPTIGSIKQAHRLNQANAFVRKASEVLGSPTMTNYLINNIDDLSRVTEGLAKQAAVAGGKEVAKETAENVAGEVAASFSDDAVKLGEKATQAISNSADNVLGEGAKAVAESADNFTDDMLKSYLDNVATGEEKAAAQNTLDTLTQYKNLSDALAPGLEEAAKTYKTQFAIDRMYMSIADDVDGVARTVAQKLSKYISSQIDNLNFGKMLGRGASGVIDDITYDGIKRAAVNVSLSEATGISVERIMSLEDDTARLLYDVMQSTRGSNKLVTNDITKYISSRNFYSLSDDVSRGTINFKKAAEQLVSASETAQRAGKALSIDDALRIMARNSSEKGKLISTLRRSEFWRDRIADYSRDIMQGYYNPHLDEHFNSDYTSIEEYVTDPTQWLMGTVFDLSMSGARKAISSIKLSSVNRKLDKLVSEIDTSKGIENDSALLAKNLRKMNSLKLEADRLTNKVFDGGISYNKVHAATTNIEKQINAKLDEVTNHFDLTKSLDFMSDNIKQAAKDSTALDRFKAFTGFGQTKVMSATEVNRMLIRSDDTLKSFIYANDALKAKFTARFADMVNSCPNVKKLTSKQYKDALINAWDNTIGTTDFAKQFGANSLVKRKDGKYTNTINVSDKAKAKELFARGQEIVWNAFYDELAKMKNQLEGVVDFRSLKTELNGLRDRIVEVGYEMIDNGQPVRWNYFPTQGLMFEGAKDTPVALTGFYYGAGEHTSLMSNITDPTRPRDTMDMSQIVSDIKSGKTEYQRELSFNEKLRAKNRGEPETEFKSVPYNEDGFNPLYAVTAYLNAYDSKKFAAPYLDPMRNGNIVIADDGILNIRMGNETAAKSIEAAKYYNNLKEGYSKSTSAKMTYSDVESSIKEAKDIILGKDSKEIAKNRAKINSQKTKLRKTISGSDQFKSIANYMDINNPTDAQIAERLQSRFSTMTSDIKAVASGANDKLSDLYNNPNSVQYRSVIDGLAKNKTALKDLNQLDGRTINFGDVDLNYSVFNKRYYGVIGIMESTQRAIDNINASKKLSPELTLDELEFMSRQNALLGQMDNVNTTNVINESVQAGTFEASTAGHKEFSALNAKFAEGTKIMGIDISGKTIEDVYQNTLKGSGKNKAPATDSILGKATADAEKKAGKALTKAEKEAISQRYYDRLWDIWGEQNPELKAQIENLPAGTKITDRFAKTGVSQANSLQRWVKPAQGQADLATIKFSHLDDNRPDELHVVLMDDSKTVNKAKSTNGNILHTMARNKGDGTIEFHPKKFMEHYENVKSGKSGWNISIDKKAKEAGSTNVDAPWSGKKMEWKEGTAKAREFISKNSPIDLSNEYGSKDSLAIWLQEGRNEAYRGGDGDEGVLKRWNSIPEEVRDKISEDRNFSRLWDHYSPSGAMSHLGIDFVYLPDVIDRTYADYLWKSSKGAGVADDALRKAKDVVTEVSKSPEDMLTWTLLHERGHDAPGGYGAELKYSGEGGKEAAANNWAYDKFFDKTSPDYIAAHDAAVKILGNMNTKPVKSGRMDFSYGKNAQPHISENTTFEAVKSGKRTSTTRLASQHADYWQDLKVGDIVEFKNKGNTDSVLVRVTKAPEWIDPTKMSDAELKSLLQKEGWKQKAFDELITNKVKAGDKALQFEYELVNKPTQASIATPQRVKVISGGQTGVDTIGLEVGKELGLETGGTAAPGFYRYPGEDKYTAKDMAAFGLKEIDPKLQAEMAKTRHNFYLPRTRQNVLNSDGTVYFSSNTNSAGYAATKRFADAEGKPFILNPTASQLREWMAANNVKTLNIAGSRGGHIDDNFSKNVKDVLNAALKDPIDYSSAKNTTVSAPRYSVEDFVKIREINESSKADITSTIYNMMLNKYGDKEFKGTKTFSSSNVKKTINQFAYDAYDAIALDKVAGEGITLAEVVERFNDTFPNAELFFEKGNLESYNTLSSKISSYQNAGGDLNTLKQDIADTLRRVNDGEIKLTPEQTRRFAAAYYDLDEASFNSERITNRGRSELSIDNKVDDEGATFESTIASSADYAKDPAEIMSENANAAPTRDGLNISIDVNADRSAIGKINNLNYVMDLMSRRKTDYKTRIAANKKTWGVFNDVIKPNYESLVNGINAQLPKGKKLNIAKVVDNSSKMSDANWLRITKQFDNGVESFSIGGKTYSRQEVAGMISNGIDGRGAIKSMDPDKLRKYIADNKLKITEPMATALATLDKTYKDFAKDFLDATNRRTVSGTLVSPKDAVNNILSSSLDVNNRPLNFDASLLASVSDAPYSSTRTNSAMKFPDADGNVAEVNIVYDYGTGSEGTTGTASYWYEKTTADGDVIRYDSEEELAASLAPNVSADDIRFAMNDAGYDLNIGEKMEPVTDWFYHGDRSTRRGIDNVGPDYEDWQIDNANVGSAKMSNKSASSDVRRINAEIKKLGDVTPLTAEEERMYKQIISSKFPYDNLSAEYKAVYDKAKRIEQYNRLLAAKRASASKAVSAGTNPMLDFVESTYAYNNTKSSIEIENALYGKDGKPGYIDTVNNLTRDNARMKLKRDSDYYEATADIIAGIREMDGSPEMKASVVSALENVKSDFHKSNAGDISDDIDKLIDETIYQLDKKYANRDELVEELIQNNPTYKAMMENIEAGKNMKRGAGQTIISIDNNGPIIVNSDADVSGKISIKQLRESRELVAMKKDNKTIIGDVVNSRKDKKILKSMRDGFTDGYSKKQLVGEATMNRQNKWIDNLVEAIKEKTGAVEIDESKVYINKTVASLGQSFFGEGTAGWQERAYKLATSLSEFNKLMQDIHLAGGVGQYNAFTLRNALTMLWQDPIGGTRALFTNFRNARDNDSVIKFFINNSEKLLKYAIDSGDFSTINKFAPMFTMRDETVGKGFFTSAIESVMDIPSTIAESESKLAGFGKAMSNVYVEMFNNPTFARWTLIADADLRMRNYDKAKKYVDRIARSFNLTDEDFETMDGGIWQSKDAYIANLARLRTEMFWRPQDFVKTKFNAKKFLAVEEAANNKRTVEALRSMPKKTTAADAFRNFFFAMNYKLQMNMHPVHGFGSVAASIYNVPRVNMQLASKQSLNLAASRFAGGGNRNEAITLIGIAALAHAWNTYIGAPSAWSQLWEDDERAKQGKFSGIAKSLQNFQDFFKVWLPDQKTGKFNPQYANSIDPAFSIFTLQNSGARALNALINPNEAHISPQRNDFGLQKLQIGDWKFGRGVEGAMDEFVGANLLAGYKAAYEVLNNNTYFGNNVWEQPRLPDGSENPNYDPGRSFMASIAHILNLDGALEGDLLGAGSNRWVKGLDIDSIYWENGQQLETPKTKGLKIGKKGKWQDKTGTVSGTGLFQHEYTTAIAAINDGDYFEALSGAMELPFKSRSYTARARTSLNQEVSMALRDAKKEYERDIEGASVEEKDKAFAKFASKAVEIVHDWSHEYGDVLGKNDELTATATKMLMAFMSDEYDDDLMYMQNMYVKLKQELRMADGDQFIFSKKAAEEAIADGMSPEEAAEKWNKHLTALKEAQMKEYKARLALEEAGINDGLDTSVFDSTDYMYDKLAAESATISKKIYTEIKGKLESPVGEFKNFNEMKSYYEGLIDEASSTKQKAKLAEKYNDYVTDVISPYVEKYGGAIFNDAYWDGDNMSNHFGKYIIIPADQYYSGKSPRANYLKNKLGIGWTNAKHPEYNENLPSDKEVKENLNEVANALAKGQISSAKALVDKALLQLRKGYIHAAPVDYDKLIRMRALLSSRSK